MRWRVERRPSQQPLLWIEWRERGGPPVTTPERQGFGTRFIEGSVASELQGKAALDYDPAGLALHACKFRSNSAAPDVDAHA